MKRKRKIKTIDKRVLKSERFDYTTNHQLIENAIFEHLMKHMVTPSYRQIAEATKLSEMTIKRHSADINLGNLLPTYKQLTPKVMRGLLIRGAKGDAAAAKLWMQVVEGLKDKVDHHHGGEVVNLGNTTDEATKKKLYQLALSEMEEKENG